MILSFRTCNRFLFMIYSLHKSNDMHCIHFFLWHFCNLPASQHSALFCPLYIYCSHLWACPLSCAEWSICSWIAAISQWLDKRVTAKFTLFSDNLWWKNGVKSLRGWTVSSDFENECESESAKRPQTVFVSSGWVEINASCSYLSPSL